MKFGLTAEHDEIADAVRRLMTRFPDDYWAERDQTHTFPTEFYDAFAEAGYLGILIPPEYGGSGLGLTETAVALGEVSGSGGGLGAATAVHLSIFGMTPVVKFGSEEMKRKYLPAVVKGDLHVCFGVTEPDAGSDTTRITTSAVRDGDHYVINGKKVWISKAMESQKCLLLTRTTPRDKVARPSEGMTLFLVDLDPSAVVIKPISKMARNSVSSCELFIENLRVHESDRVGEEGKGFRYLLDGLNAERILISFEAVGLGRAAIRRAAEYAKTRNVFDRPIGKNQSVQLPLAESLARLEAAHLMAIKAATMYDAGLPCGTEANMAKFLAGDASFEAADRALQTHGGFGYATEFHVERYFRESRLWRFAPISQNLALAYIAERVLGLPKSY
ncbi:MAG: acyl-CoA dehydrogenase family protein [Desulfobacterales bacterium]|nr:acyl-CoA dehydrogenase family protein [Desulfobacterales bacterium]